MSDAGQQPGAVAGVPAEPREMSEAEVMAGIEGLLDDKPQRPPRERTTAQRASEVPAEREHPGQPDPMPGPEDPAPSEEEGDDGYEPDTEPVEQGDDVGPSETAPNSWSREEKELFASLPPAAQEVISRRESERDRAFQQKTQEIAEHRKAIESTFVEIQQERDAYARNLQQLLFVAAPEAQLYANVNWQQLAQDQPAEYVRLTAARDEMRNRIGGIQQELQRVAAQAQQAQAQQFAQIRHAEQQRLMERLPAFADPETAPKAVRAMRDFLSERGFTPEEISGVVDHRVLLVVNEAMRASRAQQVRQQAQEKRTQPAPQVQPPGSPRQRGDTAAAQRRGQKMAALKRSGSDKDAISYLLEVL